MIDRDSHADVIAVCDDLIVATRIADGAARVGRVAQCAPSLEALRSIANRCTRLILLDLSLASRIDLETLGAIRTQCAERVRIVAFGPHIDTDLLETARSAGCDQVLPRSAFFRVLADLLAAHDGQVQD